MEVEWDEDKRLSNLARHRVDFRVAALLFERPFIEVEDRRRDYGERRYRALGFVEDESYVIVYTWRGQARRLISAWKVGEHGKRRHQAILARRAPGDA